tara:strand:- start:10366 stop:10860 length:495 start_codon:yes stop_codon:yes gene_type:complete
MNLLGFLSPYLGLASLFVQGAGTLMSVQAQQRAGEFEKQRLVMIEQQYKEQAESNSLEAEENARQRRKEYLNNISENRALMAQSGISLDSPSYRAFLNSNLDTYRNDINSISLQGLETRLNSLRNAQQTRLQAKAQKLETKSATTETITRGLMTGFKTIKEFDI